MTPGERRSESGKLIIESAENIARLRRFIKDEGARTDLCTFDVLGDVCKGCRCGREKVNHP